MVPIPPLLDYPNHLARFYVLAHPEDSIIRKFYSPAWGIVPYAATDFLAVMLQRILPLLIVGKIMLALALILPLAGIVAYHYAVYRRLSLWALSFGVFSYNAQLLLCFYNFYISCGVALLFASIWIWLKDKHPYLNPLLAAVLSAGLFLVHLYGAVFYLILLGSCEVAGCTHWNWRQAGFWKQVRQTTLRLCPAVLVIAVMDVLSQSYDNNSRTQYLPASYKLAELAYPWVGYVSGGLVIALGVWLALAVGLKNRYLSVSAAALVCFAICFGLYLVLPFELAGAALFSSRFIMMSAMVLWAGMAVDKVPGHAIKPLVIAFLGLLAFNIGSVCIAWTAEEKDITALRQVIASVEPGSRVLYVTGTPKEMQDYAPRAPFGENLTRFPAYMHFPALLVFEHDAFWPLMLSVKGTMPIRVNAPYDSYATGQGSPFSYQVLADARPAGDVLDHIPYIANWQEKFDYVLLLPTRAVPEAGHILPGKLTPVAINDFAALYRIRKP